MKITKFKKFVPVVMVAAMALTFAQSVDVPASVEMQVPGISISRAEAAEVLKAWDFSKDIGGWNFVGGWSYSGEAATSYAADFGGSLKVDVDYSYDKDQSWSEVKLSDWAVSNEAPIVVGSNGAGTISFDLYYDPAQITGDGMLKIKAYGSDVNGEEVINQIVDELGKGKDVPGSNYKKASVKIILDDVVTENIGHLEISLVSYLTGYKGAIYINNMQVK